MSTDRLCFQLPAVISQLAFHFQVSLSIQAKKSIHEISVSVMSFTLSFWFPKRQMKIKEIQLVLTISLQLTSCIHKTFSKPKPVAPDISSLRCLQRALHHFFGFSCLLLHYAVSKYTIHYLFGEDVASFYYAPCILVP